MTIILMIAATVLMVVSIIIKADWPLCHSKAANSRAFVEEIVPTDNRWPAKAIILVNLFHRPIHLQCRFIHLPKKFNNILLFHLQIHFSTKNFSISKDTCVTYITKLSQIFYVPNCNWFLWLSGSIIYTARMFSIHVPPATHPSRVAYRRFSL